VPNVLTWLDRLPQWPGVNTRDQVWLTYLLNEPESSFFDATSADVLAVHSPWNLVPVLHSSKAFSERMKAFGFDGTHHVLADYYDCLFSILFRPGPKLIELLQDFDRRYRSPLRTTRCTTVSNGAGTPPTVTYIAPPTAAAADTATKQTKAEGDGGGVAEHPCVADIADGTWAVEFRHTAAAYAKNATHYDDVTPLRRPKLACVQLRFGSSIATFANLDSKVFNTPDVIGKVMVRLRSRILEHGWRKEPNGFRVFVSTDSEQCANAMRRDLGPFHIDNPGTIVHVDRSPSDQVARSAPKTMADHFILGECDYAIISRSGFGALGVWRTKAADAVDVVEEDGMIKPYHPSLEGTNR